MTHLPKRIHKMKKANVTALVPPELRTKIVRLAKRNGRSLSFIVESLLTEAFEQREIENDSGE